VRDKVTVRVTYMPSLRDVIQNPGSDAITEEWSMKRPRSPKHVLQIARSLTRISGRVMRLLGIDQDMLKNAFKENGDKTQGIDKKAGQEAPADSGEHQA
jgi:hypothetical protein